MSDIFLGTSNTPEQQREGLGTGKYVWGQGSNDMVLDVSNDFQIIQGLTKLQQDINKVLLTDRFRGTLYPIYGSTIRNMLGQKADINVIKTNIKNAVVEALAVLQFLNSDNPNSDEQILVINTITVDMGEPGEVKVSVQITTKSGKVLNTVLPF
jgi:hypothetical protein